MKTTEKLKEGCGKEFKEGECWITCGQTYRREVYLCSECKSSNKSEVD